jgi:hypothetical protein
MTRWDGGDVCAPGSTERREHACDCTGHDDPGDGRGRGAAPSQLPPSGLALAAHPRTVA